MDENEKYDVALSFAGEQRGYVEKVAQELKSLDLIVFYDGFKEEKVRLWGRNLGEVLQEVYEYKADFVVMFISKEYVEKPWPTHERRSAISGAIQKKPDHLLTVRFDDTPVPGLQTDRAFLPASDYKPPELAQMIYEKLGSKLLPEYNIHKIDDNSYANFKRLVYRIELPDLYSETQGRVIAEHIVETKHKTGDFVNALGFFFYFPVADPNSRADGSIDWAPNGEWGDAPTVETGDYRNFRFAIQFWNKRSLPILYHSTRVRMDIFRKIAQVEAQARIESEEKGGTLTEMSALQQELSEQYKDELSETSGLSKDELKKLSNEGVKNNWPYNVVPK